VSQRIKALEQRVGQVLVVREKPCTPTAAGIPLLRLAAQTALMQAEALAEMGGSEGAAPRIAVVVNADSMATWFTRVLGAVTTERTPVPACRVQPLGMMRYIPVASPTYVKRYIRPMASPRTPSLRHRRWRGTATTPIRTC
jgi:LysR family transcriptional regulator (chromosome initiation inhibitor)